MPLRFKLNNNWAGQWEVDKGNFGIGLNANKSISTTPLTGMRNISIGNQAGAANISGANNIAIGSAAMQNNTSGSDNVAIGLNALDSNVSGSINNAIGSFAMQKNISGTGNVAIGSFAMQKNVGGAENVAIGAFAASNSYAMFSNTYVGYSSGYSSKYSVGNVGIGDRALFADTIGRDNVAIGSSALTNNINGFRNVALGTAAGYNSSFFSRNVFLGWHSGFFARSNNKLYIENSEADSTNALIYGDFAADSVNLNAKVNIKGYTRLGMPADEAPAIKMKKLTFTNGGSGAFTSVAHGLTQSKILSVSVLIFANSFNDIAPRSTFVGYEYDMFFGSTDITIINIAGNDLGLQGRPGRILITYEE
jgi:hypothetical protein